MNAAFEIALGYYGINEVPGEDHNPDILKFFSDIGHIWVQTDETAWCSAFVNYCCQKANLPSSGELDARSWMNVGVKTNEPKPGDIVIFWRESKDSWKGHVAFFVAKRNTFVYCLGGNQGDQVNISNYSEKRVLEYRKIA